MRQPGGGLPPNKNFGKAGLLITRTAQCLYPEAIQFLVPLAAGKYLQVWQNLLSFR